MTTSSPGAVLARAAGAGAGNGATAGVLVPVVLLIGAASGQGDPPPQLLLGAVVLVVYGAVVGAVVGAVLGTVFGIGLLPLLRLLRRGPRRRVALAGGLLGLAVGTATATALHAVGMSGIWWWMFGGTTLAVAPLVGAWRGPWIVCGVARASSPGAGR